jgi:hypothetical protein
MSDDHDSANIRRAPFTPDEVASLNGFQEACVWHPFTCGNDDCGHILVATEGGWTCPRQGCGYTQDWAHAFMADWRWKQALVGLEELRDRAIEEHRAGLTEEFTEMGD